MRWVSVIDSRLGSGASLHRQIGDTVSLRAALIAVGAAVGGRYLMRLGRHLWKEPA